MSKKIKWKELMFEAKNGNRYSIRQPFIDGKSLSVLEFRKNDELVGITTMLDMETMIQEAD